MSDFSLTPEAEDDLNEIWDYIARDSWRAADRTVAKMEVEMERLAEFPYLGTRRPAYSSEMRMRPVGRYLIFYEPRDWGVRISRVVAADRDTDALFRKDQDSGE